MKPNTLEKIRSDLRLVIEAGGSEPSISMSAAARGIGVSVTAVSQFLSAKYQGDNDRLAEKVHSWLQRQAEKRQYTEILRQTILTGAVKRLMQTARACHIQRDIGVATGQAGVGKTRACKLYAKQNPDVILIETMPYYTARYLMADIHRGVGYNGVGTVINMTNDVIDKLKDSGRLIIIDEAEHLPYKALELIRRLYDKAGIGLLLVGMPQLITNLRGNHGQYRQLYSRIGVHSLIPELAENDVKALVGSAIPNSNGVWKNFAGETDNARALGKLLKHSIQISKANDSPVTGPTVQQAKKYIII